MSHNNDKTTLRLADFNVLIYNGTEWDGIKKSVRWNRVEWKWPRKIMGWDWDKRVLEYSWFHSFLYVGKEMIG